MTKVHWISIDTSSYSPESFQYILLTDDIPYRNIDYLYKIEKWCIELFGDNAQWQYQNFYLEARWHLIQSVSKLYFRNKEDMILFLMTWQDIEI